MPLLSQLALEEEPQLPGPWLTRAPSEAVMPPALSASQPLWKGSMPPSPPVFCCPGNGWPHQQGRLRQNLLAPCGLRLSLRPRKGTTAWIPGTSNSPPLPVLLPSSPLHKLPFSFKVLVVQSRLQHMNLIHTMNHVSRSSPYILFSIS